ncbi:MAG: queuosine precursor transporter [Thermoproteus sp.]
MEQIALLLEALAAFGLTAVMYRVLLSATRVDPTVLAISFYMVLLTVSQYAASKITNYLGFLVPAGTMTYVATVAMLDIIVLREGFHYARNVVLAGFLSQWLITAVNYVVYYLPSPLAPNSAYAPVFLTSARVAFASPIAYLAAETLDAYMVAKIGGAIWKRVFYSDPVAMAVDTLVFMPIAFWGVLPPADFWTAVAGLLLSKISLAPVVVGVVYLNRKYLLKSAYEKNGRPYIRP